MTYCCCQPEPYTRPRKSSEDQGLLLPRSTLLLSPGLFNSPDTKLSREHNDPTPAKDSVSILINAGIYSGVNFRKSISQHSTRTTFPPFSPSSIVRSRTSVIPEADTSTPDHAHDAVAILAAGIQPSTSTVAELDETDYFAAAPSPANVEQHFVTIDVSSNIDPAAAAEVEAFISGFPEDEQRLRRMSSSSITESVASDMDNNSSFMMSPLHSAKRSMELDNYIAPPTTSIWTSPAVVLPTESAKHGISARKYSTEDGTFMFERNVFKAPDFSEGEKPKEEDAVAYGGAGLTDKQLDAELEAHPPGPPKSAKKKPGKRK
jgi:hypothetical protein